MSTASTGSPRLVRHETDVADRPDAVLVADVGDGVEQAWAELYRRHRRSVHFAASRRCGAILADEVVQEVFVRLWRAPERFDARRGSLRSYLVMQATGRAIDLLRSESSRAARQQRVGRRDHDEHPGVETVVLARWAGTDVRRAVEALPPPERQAIALAYFGGHTYREVAHLLDLPEGTVKGRIRTGLARLRAHLVDNPDSPALMAEARRGE
ncbi:sigma-70 family RNA polymerase sigma factor [soil metagenome]